MIPKIIHYCWFGHNPLPELAQKCIASWKKYLPDYEIKEWNEENFDVNMIHYTKEAYECKKYAFVSDYARFWILYKYGGLYFDTDVEVIKNMDDIIAKGSFMGCENEAKAGATPAQLGVAPGLGLGVNPGQGLYLEILANYNKLHFLVNGVMNKKTIVEYITEILVKKGLENTDKVQCVEGMYIYPKDYFCPLGLDGKMDVTQNTRSIHHYMASWSDNVTFCGKMLIRIKKIAIMLLPNRFVNTILYYKKAKREAKVEQLFRE